MRAIKLASSIAMAIVVGVLVAAPASAQDAPTYDAQPTFTEFTWTGPYAGFHAGAVIDGGFTRFDRTTGDLPNNTDALATGLRPSSFKLSETGFTGGAQIGFNHQFAHMGGWPGGIVAGLETDIAYLDIEETETVSNTTFIGPLGAPSATPVTRINEYQGELNYLGTVRARLGVAYDKWLLYGTAGFAYGDVGRRVTFYGPNAPTTPFFTGTDDGVKTGHVYGGGLEVALPTDTLNFFRSSAVTLRTEYIHYDLGDDTLSYPGVNGGAQIGGYTSRVRTDGDIVRAALNYKF